MPQHRNAIRPLGKLALALALLCVGIVVQAVVNPSLQPYHIFDRYDAVLSLTISAVDAEKQTAELTVLRTFKGEFAAKKVTIAVTTEAAGSAFAFLAKPGTTVVAFVGQKTSRQKDAQGKILLYLGGRGRWQVGRCDAVDPSRWTWSEDLNPLEAADGVAMLGTFNGQPERLAEMMADSAKGRAYFPSVPYVQFKEDLVVATLAKPVKGVAICDLNGDGKPDLYACSDAGNRAFVQTGPATFIDATAALGLDGVSSPSVSLADVNADGVRDLLAGGALYLGAKTAAGVKYATSELVPKEATAKLKLSAFVEINGDGYPDIVVSQVGGGLHAYLNPGAQGGPFVDATKALGLDAVACGAGQTGFFTPGDWDGDHRTDLFYAVGKGLLLVQGKDGRFAPLAHGLEYSFLTDGESTAMTGGGCFASLWRAGSSDLVFATEGGVNWVGNVDGKARDLIYFGNEINVGAHGLLASIAEDLSGDGDVDVYSINGQEFKNTIHINRGYGSFTTPTNYKPDVFSGPAHEAGAGGVAAGDVNGDGLNDLLLGGSTGALTLLINQTPTGRAVTEGATSQEQILAGTSMLTAVIGGKLGVIGAEVTLSDADGVVVGRRVIGANVATGCQGPDTVNLAVRWLGAYRLHVRYADGTAKDWPITFNRSGRQIVQATRD